MMNHLKKITLLITVFSLFFIVSCGSDDEASVDLSEVEFAFDASNPPIDQTVINNLNNSGDPNALQISSNLTSANAMTTWISLFNQTSGAEESNVPIGTCGGNAVVYTYSYGSGDQSFTVAYQICEESNKYIFQIFFSQNGSTPALFIYAEQSKTANEGFMEIYGSAIGVSEVETVPVITYTWEENTDGSFLFTVSDSDGGFMISIVVNDDNSGELSYTIDGNLYYEATWNADGTAGTYAYYDDEGNETESGNWPS
ncbi:MAG: hypothetical protein RLN88_03270 [Ekhidna sp.]|uniref:hypothetical protein n=1 Tax=Ekhidna sp. TaxID=2608089 RepID=UPI0032ED0523